MLCYGYLTPPKITPTPTSSEDSMEISDYALIGIHHTILPSLLTQAHICLYSESCMKPCMLKGYS